MANVIRKGSTYYAPKGSYYEGNVRIDGDFIVPARTHFWGRLVVTGRLELGMKSSVALDVECRSAIIGSHARVKGPLVASDDVILLDHCVVYSVQAGGKVIIRPDVHVGDVTSSDAIVVHGKIKSGKLTGKSMKVIGN
ncbi:polymer-forming cytoskeletal protein [Methanoregula sp.]|jgi:cytoskeletal protein CcmA (bactofilin family)|uniref:polymer-forming cytoskeletal protein n=1 Tax=Methanoregula sp. TaxID=2052170 RepID=UPI0025DF102B|nr:polymer-forming cytoskeletal protein [Methanoregula sp.]